MARRWSLRVASPSLKPRPRELEQQLAKHEAESGSEGKLARLHVGLTELIAAVEAAEAELQTAEADEEKSRFDEAKARALAASAKLVHQEVDTELATLTKLLAPAHDWSPIVEEIKVTAGYEQALGAALGDDLDAASDETAPSHWRAITGEGDQALPDEATPLSQFVKAPKALHRRLAQIGVVEAGRGRELQAMLAPGQRLVSKEGDLWRWDGYSVQAGTASAAGARLVERRRLEALKIEVATAEAHAAEAEAELQAASRQGRNRPTQDQGSTPGGQDGACRARPRARCHRRRRARGAIGRQGARRAGRSADPHQGCPPRGRAHGAKVAAGLLELASLAGLEAALEAAQSKAAQSRQAAARAEAALEGFEREVQHAAGAAGGDRRRGGVVAQAHRQCA